ncbi:cellulase family glycosylhydrolase [Porcipelethomonas ammoniilytica]|uniref:cellulase family glycosylhydrolase n=1 Tax=Porcipelethomonas ammoniilytica TaxID=2981722 RepID=UPI0008234F0F|nr:cellulase family glycosylhydrolase [Porcipelethomonas ammoniilytica]MCU6719073.1 cellulase family glycosylhydrolase [Porcipelethomonas ammoniilytica]SCI68591.1 Endoglucanase A precursor [uncultured Ruminococcus sp.]
MMSLKKKILSVITSAACIMSCVCMFGNQANDQYTAEAVGLTGQSAFDITSQMVIGWNLGNSLDSTNDNLTMDSSPKKFAMAWGNPEPTKELIEAVKNGGFNTIRIPTTWYQHLYLDESTNTYKIDTKWLAYVKQFVDYAYDMDMFVILNVHHENWVNVAKFTDETYNDASKKLNDIWSCLAETFKDYDQHLVFEGMNEPRETNNPSNSEWGDGDANSWNYINRLNKVFVDAVRGQGSSYNKERLLMLPGYHAGNSVSTVRAIEIPENSGNVALSVHAYNPYFFCMDTSNMANHTYPGASGYGSDYKTELQTMFNSYKSIIAEKNVPIVMGEFSASDFNNTDSRINWAKDYLSMAKDAGIPCVLWDNNVVADGNSDNGEAHGYIYRLTNTWYPNSAPVIAAMMDTVGVSDYNLPEYKEYVAPEFSWDNVKIGDDWIELYYNKDGNALTAWTPDKVSGWQQYLNEDYMYAMVFDAMIDPAIVAQTSNDGWYYILSDNDLNSDFVLYYTYEDIKKVFDSNSADIGSISDLYVSAHAGDATIYGLYAVPVNSVQPSTEETTEETTEEVKPDIIPGDVNEDKRVNVFDSVALRRMLLNNLSHPVPMVVLPPSPSPADTNGNGTIEIADLVLLNQWLVGMDVKLTTYVPE